MFVTPLILSAIPTVDLWTLEAPLIWSDAKYGLLEVPAGFVTDLASIPRLFRNLPDGDPDGVSRRPAAMHDWLYGSKEGRAHGKDFADHFLMDSMIAEGSSRFVASAFYLAVHFGGVAGWNSDAATAL